MASLGKVCVNLLYSQVGRVTLSLYELNKSTLVYSQAEEQGPLSQVIKYDYNNKSNEKQVKQFPTWSQNWFLLSNGDSHSCCYFHFVERLLRNKEFSSQLFHKLGIFAFACFQITTIVKHLTMSQLFNILTGQLNVIMIKSLQLLTLRHLE